MNPETTVEKSLEVTLEKNRKAYQGRLHTLRLIHRKYLLGGHTRLPQEVGKSLFSRLIEETCAILLSFDRRDLRHPRD